MSSILLNYYLLLSNKLNKFIILKQFVEKFYARDFNFNHERRLPAHSVLAYNSTRSCCFLMPFTISILFYFILIFCWPQATILCFLYLFFAAFGIIILWSNIYYSLDFDSFEEWKTFTIKCKNLKFKLYSRYFFDPVPCFGDSCIHTRIASKGTTKSP